jgi:hypothetical protein
MPALFANSAGIVHDGMVLRHLALCRGVMVRRGPACLKLPPGIRPLRFLKPAAIL